MPSPANMSVKKHLAFDVRVDLAPHEEASWIPLIKADISANQSKFKKLLIGGPEIGEQAGKRHVHCYVEFKSQTTIPALKQHLRLTGLVHFYQQANRNDYDRIRAHHSKLLTKENPDVLILIEHPAYITPIDIGIERSDIDDGKITDRIQRVIESGGTLEQVKALSYGWYASHSGFVDRELLKYQKLKTVVNYEHLWIYGEPGTGKTGICHELFPDAHRQDVSNPKFEGYDGQDVVILNDFDNKTLRLFTVARIKNLCDPGGTKIQVNYGCVQVAAKIVVTSNYSIADCFKYKGKNPKFQEEFDENDVDYIAIKRRFREVKIGQFLFEQNLQLKNQFKLRNLTDGESIFEPYNVERSDGDVYSECNYRHVEQAPSITTTEAAVELIEERNEEEERYAKKRRILDKVEELKKGGLCRDENCGREGIMSGSIHIHWNSR